MKIKKQVRRFDLGEIRSATRTPQGFLMCPGFATRVGVFPYMNADGSVRYELRHPDDVFDPDSLATLKYAPVTIEHPPEMITSKNVAKYGKGHTTERVEVNRNLIDVDLIIENDDAIKCVEDEGIRELSSGYTADVIDESGVYEGTAYDCRQKNIRYNHLALVKRGRAGPEVRLRLDSQDAVMQEDLPKPAENTFSQESSVVDADLPVGGGMKKVIILGREVDLPSDIAEAVQEYKDRFDEIRAKLSQLEESMGKQVRKDEDVSQKGISPQVKVEQQTPDGRSAGGKTAAKPGTITGGPTEKSDEELEDAEDDKEEKEDGDEDEKESKEKKEDGENPFEKLKKDMDEKQSKHDAEMDELKGKMDELAAASMSQPEKKEDSMSKADMQKAIRARAKLERQAEKLVPVAVSNKFDSMSDKEIYSAVIKHRHPKADLTDKSKTYLQSRFDSITESLAEEGTVERQNAGKALLGLGGGRFDSSERNDADPAQARLKMLQRDRDLYKEPLSASKK